jgi:ketosteroid isomerase-like protein
MAKRMTKKKKPAARRTTARRPTAKRATAKTTRAKPQPKSAARSSRAGSAGNPMEALARRIVAVSTGGDDEAALALYADDAESTEPGQETLRGIDALRRKFEMFRGMMSDSSFTARRTAVGPDAVMVEWEGTMTFAGGGKTVRMSEVAVHEIKNGKIVRERYYYDPAVMQP